MALIFRAQGKTHLIFSPQWHAQAQFAGYIVAQHLGYYQAEGLDVEIKYPTETLSSLRLMSEGKADLITTMLTDAIMLKANQEMDLVNVMQTSQHSSLCLVKKPGNETANAQSFKQLRVGLWSTGLARPAEVMNKMMKLNWNIILFRSGFNLMNYNMVDAISAMEYNELLRMKYSGWDVSDRSVLHLSDNGFDMPEDGVYCLRSYYDEHKNVVQAFVRASKKGWEWCRQHPKEAISYIIQDMRQNHVYSSKVIQKASLKIILEKQQDAAGKVPYELSVEQFDKCVNMLKTAQFIDSSVDYHQFIAK